MNEAYWTFWAWKGTFGGTWGLKSRVVHWIYTSLIRPVLTSSSTVWCLGVRYNVSRMELSKLQKSTCLAVTGVMKTTPAAAMEVLQGFLPLYVIVEVGAQAGIYQLLCTQQ